MTTPTICRAILMGDYVMILNWSGQREILASFSVSARKSVRQRIAQFETKNNCIVENYTDGMIGKYRDE
jgi:hypothetical protein